MVPQDTKITPKMAKWRSQAFQNHIFLMFSNACHTNHQMHVDRGPAAEGVALKINRIDYLRKSNQVGYLRELNRIGYQHDLNPV